MTWSWFSFVNCLSCFWRNRYFQNIICGTFGPSWRKFTRVHKSCSKFREFVCSCSNLHFSKTSFMIHLVERGNFGKFSVICLNFRQHCSAASSSETMPQQMDLPPANSQEEQVALELSGPEQGVMEPMPPFMEYFKVERLSVVIRCSTIAIYSSLCNDDTIWS